jgi:DNA polymerase-3 subunit delta
MQEIQHIREAVGQEKIPSVYLWHGEERFFILQALLELKKFYLQGDPSGSGIEVLSAKEWSPADIVTAANMSSFFQKRLVIVEDASCYQEIQPEDLKLFQAYLANPNPDACLLFIADKVQKGRKFYKALEKAAAVCEFALPKREREWEAWLASELHSRGKTMSVPTMMFFLDWAGHRPGVLSQELDKLAIYLGAEETVIKEKDIRAITTRTAEANIFEMLNAVAQRQIDQALQRFHEVLREEHPLKILTLLVRQVRLLLGAVIWRQRGGECHWFNRCFGNQVFIRGPKDLDTVAECVGGIIS